VRACVRACVRGTRELTEHGCLVGDLVHGLVHLALGRLLCNTGDAARRHSTISNSPEFVIVGYLLPRTYAPTILLLFTATGTTSHSTATIPIHAEHAARPEADRKGAGRARHGAGSTADRKSYRRVRLYETDKIFGWPHRDHAVRQVAPHNGRLARGTRRTCVRRE
jgi:hypothetical protein